MLETIDLDAITPRGYAFQIETTYRVKQAGFRVVEIPITFNDRAAGKSKMSKAIVLEAVWAVPLLRLRGSLARMRSVTDDTFETEVLQRSKARRRRLLGAVVRSVQGDRAGSRRARRRERGRRIREDRHRQNRRTADRFSVLSLPTVMLFQDGEPRETVYGARSKKHFQKKFESYF